MFAHTSFCLGIFPFCSLFFSVPFMSVPFLSSSLTCSCCRLLFLFSPCKSALYCFDVWIVSDCVWLPSAILLCTDIATLFLFIHLCLIVLCTRARGWGSPGFQTDAEWQRLTRAAVLGQRATRIACIHLCCTSIFSSSVVFLPLIYPSPTASCRNQVTPNMCRKVRELVVVRDMSAQAQCCSSLHHHHRHHHQPLLLIPVSVLVRKPLSLISPKLRFSFLLLLPHNSTWLL